MYRIAIMNRLLIAACTILAACQCGRTDLEARLALEVPPLLDGEVCRYRVLAGGDSIGTYTSSLFHDWLEPGLDDEEPQPVFALILVTRTTTGNVPVADSSLLYVHRHNLAPRSSFRFIRTGNALSTTAANYSVHSVAVSGYASGQEVQRLLPVGNRTFDIDGVILLGRALRLETRKPIRISVINPMGPPFGGVTYDADFTWLGDELITVPAGVFDCRRVRLSMGEEKLDLWYERAGTKRLVRYTTSGSGITVEMLPPAPIPKTAAVSSEYRTER